MRITIVMAGGEANLFHQGNDLFADIAASDEAMDNQWFGDYFSDSHAWIERRVGVLENHLHVAAQNGQLTL